MRLRSPNTPTSLLYRSDPLPEKVISDFWERVEKTDGCWNWIGSINKNGYGQMSVDSFPLMAHRISYFIRYGPLVEGLCVCHECNNPRCVRPDPEHLLLETQKYNMQTAARLGRLSHRKHARGSAHGISKFTESDVAEIRRRYRGGESVASIHKTSFSGLTRGALYHIVHNRYWKHVK